MKKTKINYASGFSLVETLIFTLLVSMIFLTLTTVITASLRDAKINEHKLLATRRAEELRDWLEGEKEKDWANFIAIDSGDAGQLFCVNSLPGDITLLETGPCQQYGLDSKYKRDLNVTKKPAACTSSCTRALIEIDVEWRDGQNVYSVPNNTLFALWE